MSRHTLLLIILTAGAMAPVVMAADNAHDVGVNEVRGVYHVIARFAVPQPPATVLQVLTGYERIPRFMPDLQSSVVRERAGCRVVVEQEAIAKLMMFSKRIHLLLEVHEKGDSVQFIDRSGKSFIHYEGAWRVAAGGHGTLVSYELTAKPSFSVPEFILTRLLRRDARQMIERLQAEIAAHPADGAAR